MNEPPPDPRDVEPRRSRRPPPTPSAPGWRRTPLHRPRIAAELAHRLERLLGTARPPVAWSAHDRPTVPVRPVALPADPPRTAPPSRTSAGCRRSASSPSRSRRVAIALGSGDGGDEPPAARRRRRQQPAKKAARRRAAQLPTEPALPAAPEPAPRTRRPDRAARGRRSRAERRRRHRPRPSGSTWTATRRSRRATTTGRSRSTRRRSRRSRRARPGRTTSTTRTRSTASAGRCAWPGGPRRRSRCWRRGSPIPDQTGRSSASSTWRAQKRANSAVFRGFAGALPARSRGVHPCDLFS